MLYHKQLHHHILVDVARPVLIVVGDHAVVVVVVSVLESKHLLTVGRQLTHCHLSNSAPAQTSSSLLRNTPAIKTGDNNKFTLKPVTVQNYVILFLCHLFHITLTPTGNIFSSFLIVRPSQCPASMISQDPIKAISPNSG